MRTSAVCGAFVMAAVIAASTTNAQGGERVLLTIRQDPSQPFVPGSASTIEHGMVSLTGTPIFDGKEVWWGKLDVLFIGGNISCKIDTFYSTRLFPANTKVIDCFLQ